MSKYTLSARARLDIQLIWNYIAERNFDAADRVRDELREAMRQLADMPGMGHQRSDVSDPRLRFWSVRSYVIAYYAEHEADSYRARRPWGEGFQAAIQVAPSHIPAFFPFHRTPQFYMIS